MELAIRPNPCPQVEGAHRYRLFLATGVPLTIQRVTGRLVAPDGEEVYRQDWDPRELFGTVQVAAGETVLAPRLTLGRYTGCVVHWTVAAREAGGTTREAAASVALTLPEGAKAVLYQEQPRREAVVAWPGGDPAVGGHTPGGGTPGYTPGGTPAGTPARTAGAGRRYPALVLVHGSESSAATVAWLATWAARRGYLGVALSQPGFGNSDGPADFAGPRTVAALRAGWEWVRRLPGVDAERMGLWGVSRGAVAAANLATSGPLPGLRALVLQAGAYDLLAPELAPLRERLAGELRPGGSPAASGSADCPGQAGVPASPGGSPLDDLLRERSALLRAGQIPCPVLILHGDRDAIIPEQQSARLARRLAELGRSYEYRVYPGRGHFLPATRVWEEAIFPFLDAQLLG